MTQVLILFKIISQGLNSIDCIHSRHTCCMMYIHVCRFHICVINFFGCLLRKALQWNASLCQRGVIKGLIPLISQMNLLNGRSPSNYIRDERRPLKSNAPSGPMEKSDRSSRLYFGSASNGTGSRVAFLRVGESQSGRWCQNQTHTCRGQGSAPSTALLAWKHRDQRTAELWSLKWTLDQEWLVSYGI